MQLLNVKLLMGLCVTLAATKSSPAPQCQSACLPFWVPFKESCYRIFPTKLSWTAAEESCNQHFSKFAIGHLVSIRSEDENRFVSYLWSSFTGEMFTHVGGYKDSGGNVIGGYNGTYWIGLTDKVVEGRWVWVDTQAEARHYYTKWRSGEPSNSYSGQHCAHQVKIDGNSLTWNDLECDDSRSLFYVCELPRI